MLCNVSNISRRGLLVSTTKFQAGYLWFGYQWQHTFTLKMHRLHRAKKTQQECELVQLLHVVLFLAVAFPAPVWVVAIVWGRRAAFTCLLCFCL